MNPSLTARRPGRAVTRFSRKALVAGIAVLALLICGSMFLHVSWEGREAAVATEEPRPQSRKLPEVITDALPPQSRIIATAGAGDQPPIAATPPSPTITEKILDMAHPLAGYESSQKSQAPTAAKPAETSRPATAPPAPESPPSPVKERKGWTVMAVPKESSKASTSPPPLMVAQVPGHAQPDGRPGQDLIHPARWAIPEQPLKTIYRSQTLTGVLLQAVNSDIPGQVKIQLTTPVLDKFGYDTTILPKGTLIIATQGGRVQYGDARLALKIEQLEFPSGEVVDLRATVGDTAGANGLKGKVNNHYGKLILGTGLSALLNIGVRSAVGTPGRNQFFQDPLQEAAQDVGQSVQRTTTDIISREMQVRPTLTIPAGAFCTINLQENMQFHRPPVVAR